MDTHLRYLIKPKILSISLLNMIRTIIFDFGGVLGSDADAWETNFERILEITRISLIQMNQIYKSHSLKLNLGKQELSDLWKVVCKQSKKDIKITNLQKIYESNISINRDVLNLAIELKHKGFNMEILSNESKDGMKIKTKKFNLDKIFSNIYCSAFLGMAKPDQKIFEYALNDLRIGGGEAVFIDDRKENIRSA